MAYGSKYTCTFVDYYNRTVLLYIRERDYSSSVSNITLSGTPILYTKQTREQEFYSRINGSTLEIEVVCQSAGEYDEFFTSDSRKYQVEMQIASTTFWVGYIEPNLMDRPVQNIYTMRVVATDGLGYLKNVEFKQSDGTFFEGYLSLWYLLWYSISQIDSSPVFRDATDIYNQLHDTDYSPLTQTYIYSSWLRESKTKAKTCWTVIEEVLKLFLCRLQHSNGRWEIIPCDLAGNYTIRIMLGESGTINNTTPITPEIAITGATADAADRNVYINHSQHLYLMPAYKHLNVIQEYGAVNNLFAPLEQDDFIRVVPYGVDPPISHHYYADTDLLTIKYLRGEANVNSYIEYNLGVLEDENVLIELSIVVKDVMYNVPLGVIVVIQSASGNQYLHSDGEWRSNLSSLFYGWTPTTYEITSTNIPNGGTLKVWFSLYADDLLLTQAYHQGMVTIDVGSSKISLNNFADNIPDSVTHTETAETENSFIPDDITVTLGDLPTTPPNQYLVFTNGLYRLSGSDYIPTESGNWYSAKTVNWGYQSIASLMAKRVMALSALSRYKLTGQCLSHWWPYTQPTTLSRTFLISDTEYDVKRSVWNATLYEIARDDEHILLESGDDLLLEDGTSLMNKE